MDHNGTTQSIIDSLFLDHHLLTQHLLGVGEISLLNVVESNFTKILLFSAASYFEYVLTEGLIRILSERTNGCEPIVEFLKNKAISRQFHTYFNWDGRNANQFFGLFGSNFRGFMSNQVNIDSQLDDSIKAFLELVRLRNEIAHQNFANFPLEKTAQEIYGLYTTSRKFVEGFPDYLKGFLDNQTQPT